MENFFSSPAFVLACIVTLILYYIPFPSKVRSQIQLLILVMTSFFVYWLAAGNLIFLLLCSAMASAFFSYATAYGKTERRRLHLIAGVAINLSLLIFFKYKRFLMPEPIFTGWFGGDPTWREIYAIALPIGISFYVFHGISLIIDSYRTHETLASSGRHPLVHFFKAILYISFFPKIVAGPIAKGKFFYPQIAVKQFKDIPWASALRAMAQGFFLKEVIANNLNQLTATMMKPELWPHTSSAEMASMMVGYSMQIFADFGGYSLIAIGLGHLFGYQLPINFKQPYFADSFSNFWQRWHISLSSWLRDYLYIPLGGNRISTFRTYLNLMIVMFLGGLWHGPEWKYATWGVVHGLALAGERFTNYRHWQPHGPWSVIFKIGRILFVFTFVTIAWLFFRLNSIGEVTHYLASILHWKFIPGPYYWAKILLLWFFCGLILIQHLLDELRYKGRLGWFVRHDALFAGFFIAITLIARGKESAFIYFQF